MRRLLILLLILAPAAPLGGQTSSGNGAQFEPFLLESMDEVLAWLEKFNARVDALVAREQGQQLSRRMDRFARSLYDLCAAKDELAISLESRLATEEELRDDANDIDAALRRVRRRYRTLGASLAQAGDSSLVRAEEQMRLGLDRKLEDLDRVAYRAREADFNRTAAARDLRKASASCRKAQAAASQAAARLGR